MVSEDGFERRCKGIKADGTRCKSTFVANGAEFCPAHGPGGKERMSAMGKVGGKAKNLRRQSGELPDLKTAEDAQKWLQHAARLVLKGDMDAKEANALRALVKEWREANADDITQKKIAKIERRIASFKDKVGE